MFEEQFRRMSVLPNDRATNALWDKFESALDDFTESADYIRLDLARLFEYYTHERVAKYADSKTASLIKSVRTAFPDINATRLGYAEADLLYWLSRPFTTQPMLNLVGNRGAGKSALVYFVLRYLWCTSKDLHSRWLPLIIDLRQTDIDAQYGDFFYAIRSAIINHNAYFSDQENPVLLFDEPISLNHIAHTPDEELKRARCLELLRNISISAESRGQSLIIVFDNYDNLHPRSASRILALARGVTLEAQGSRVLMTMRPFSRRSQIERNTHLSGFACFHIPIEPPNLQHILLTRINALQETRPTWGHYVSFHKGVCNDHGDDPPSDDPPSDGVCQTLSDLVRQIVTKEFTANISYTIVCQLCGGDVRQAMKAVRRYFRSPHLMQDESAESIHDESLPFHMLKGVMLDDHGVYRDPEADNRPIVVNIFSLGPNHVSASKLIQARLLQLLFAMPMGSSKRLLVLFASRLGYNSDETGAAISKLLAAKLVDSPDHDERDEFIEWISVSETGRYYLRCLIRDDEYLYNIVPDIFLSHGAWQNDRFGRIRHYGRSDEFRLHVYSLFELANELIKEEDREIEFLSLSRDSEVINMLVEADSVAVAVIRSIDELLDRAMAGRNALVSRLAFDQLAGDGEFRHVKKRLQDLLVARSELKNRAAVASNRKHSEHAIGLDCVLRVEFPELLEEGQLHAIEARLPEDSELLESRVAAWLFPEDARFAESTPLVQAMGQREGRRWARWLVSAKGEGMPFQASIVLTADGMPFGAARIGTGEQ